jgi:hypothetical protein
MRHSAKYPHHEWAKDFHLNATTDGRRLKFLKVIDENSRTCLPIKVIRRRKV